MSQKERQPVAINQPVKQKDPAEEVDTNAYDDEEFREELASITAALVEQGESPDEEDSDGEDVLATANALMSEEGKLLKAKKEGQTKEEIEHIEGEITRLRICLTPVDVNDTQDDEYDPVWKTLERGVVALDTGDNHPRPTDAFIHNWRDLVLLILEFLVTCGEKSYTGQSSCFVYDMFSDLSMGFGERLKGRGLGEKEVGSKSLMDGFLGYLRGQAIGPSSGGYESNDGSDGSAESSATVTLRTAPSGATQNMDNSPTLATVFTVATLPPVTQGPLSGELPADASLLEPRPQTSESFVSKEGTTGSITGAGSQLPSTK
jgi:hypothetical protein